MGDESSARARAGHVRREPHRGRFRERDARDRRSASSSATSSSGDGAPHSLLDVRRSMGEPQWVKRFAQAERPGAYLRVLKSGTLRPATPSSSFGPDVAPSRCSSCNVSTTTARLPPRSSSVRWRRQSQFAREPIWKNVSRASLRSGYSYWSACRMFSFAARRAGRMAAINPTMIAAIAKINSEPIGHASTGSRRG